MREASRVVLGGFELNVDSEVVRWPDRFMDEDRGRVMWDRVMGLIGVHADKDKEQTKEIIGDKKKEIDLYVRLDHMQGASWTMQGST
jgi:hypothetical protein